MRIEVNDKDKTVFVWMTSTERDNLDLHEQLRPMFQKYKEQKYIVATFESGSQDLYEPFLRMTMQRKSQTS